MIRVVEVEQTCFACPTSWVGKTDDSKEVYARYRWGYLCVTVDNETVYHRFHGKPDEDDLADSMLKAGWSDEVVRKMKSSEEMMKSLCEEVGQQMSYDGSLTYDELREYTKDCIKWPPGRWD